MEIKPEKNRQSICRFVHHQKIEIKIFNLINLYIDIYIFNKKMAFRTVHHITIL